VVSELLVNSIRLAHWPSGPTSRVAPGTPAVRVAEPNSKLVVRGALQRRNCPGVNIQGRQRLWLVGQLQLAPPPPCLCLCLLLRLLAGAGAGAGAGRTVAHTRARER
jgi:hypothetical protein